jgi:hypothetical protein
VSNPLDNERLQFFFRHRDAIKEWAAIERDVTLAVRELLGTSQLDLEERIRALDPRAEAIRFDGGRYERIQVRHPDWPERIGATLEWELEVDPFGGALPKYGLFFLNEDPTWALTKQAAHAKARASGLLSSAGYKPSGAHWPAVRYVSKSTTWWQEPDAWLASIVDGVVQLWPEASAIITDVLKQGAHVPNGPV